MDYPLLVTAAIITDNDKILLIKRGRDPFKGKWSLVGGCGAFKTDKDPKDAVIKEVQIDIGCKFSPIFFNYNFAEFEIPTVTMFFHGPISGDITPSSKHVVEYRWFEFNEIDKLDLAFDHKKVLLEFTK